MTTALQKTDHNKPLVAPVNGGPATWDTVKYWADMASKLSHASIAAQVMAGFALLELRKQHGNQGKRNDLSDSPDSSGSTSPNDLEKLDWPDAVKKHAGVSDDTARNWMKMAEGIRAKWKKLSPQDKIRQLMSVPVSDWSEKQITDVQTAVRKATDGMTQTEFLRELGLAKKPSGNPNGNRTVMPNGTRLSISEQADLRKQQASEDWAAIYRLVCAYRDKFVLLADADVEAQIATIEEALNARRAWLKAPAGKRDARAIAEMFKTK